MKEQQKQYLIDMMKSDEELGLYEETLEQAAAEFAKNHSIYPTAQDDTEYGFIYGAKWQQERMYSEEEVGELLYNVIGQCAKHHNIIIDGRILNDLFEQFKKK